MSIIDAFTFQILIPKFRKLCSKYIKPFSKQYSQGTLTRTTYAILIYLITVLYTYDIIKPYDLY